MLVATIVNDVVGCCVVAATSDAEKCRGFGYVTYSMAEDSQRAVKEIRDYDGQRISVSVAKKKQQDQRKAGESEAVSTSQYRMQLCTDK